MHIDIVLRQDSMCCMSRREEIDLELQRLLRIITAEPDVVRVIVFGSFAQGYGMIHPWSDIDLCIIQQTGLRFYARLAWWLEKLKPGIGLDLVVYTPSEVEDMRQRGEFYTEEIEKKGKDLYVA